MGDTGGWRGGVCAGAEGGGGGGEKEGQEGLGWQRGVCSEKLNWMEELD